MEVRLRDLGLALNSSLELSNVLQMLCRTGRDILHADVVFLWSVDTAAAALEAVHVVGGAEADLRGRRIPLSARDSLVARVCRLLKPEVVASARLSRLVDQPLTTMLGAQSLPRGSDRQGTKGGRRAVLRATPTG